MSLPVLLPFGHFTYPTLAPREHSLAQPQLTADPEQLGLEVKQIENHNGALNPATDLYPPTGLRKYRSIPMVLGHLAWLQKMKYCPLGLALISGNTLSLPGSSHD